MGLNTGWPEVPAELEGVATSLNLESGAPVDRTLLARRVLEGVEARYELLCRAADGTGAAIMLDEARRNSATLGHRVRVSLDAAPRARAARERSEQERETDRGATRRPASSLNPVAAPANGARSLEGVASDLDAAGRLLITDDAGAVHSVSVGDVVHLRPA